MESILQPSKDIAPEYEAVAVATKDGRVITGLRVNETNFNIQLREENGRFHSFLKRDLDEVKVLKKSLMPENFGELLTVKELHDLFAYLMTSGMNRHGARPQSPARAAAGRWDRTGPGTTRAGRASESSLSSSQGPRGHADVLRPCPLRRSVRDRPRVGGGSPLSGRRGRQAPVVPHAQSAVRGLGAGPDGATSAARRLPGRRTAPSAELTWTRS